MDSSEHGTGVEDRTPAPAGNAWRLPHDLFRFTTTERADLHTAVMQVFADANERLVTALGLDDVRAGLTAAGWLTPVDDVDLASVLRALTGWGLVDVSQDHAHAYATADEYERKNLRYSLTRAGEAAVAGVAHALAQLEAAGALQTAVLDAIADRLAQLAQLMDPGDPRAVDRDDRRIHTTLMELEGHLDALRNGTKQFAAELQRLLRDEGADPTVFRDVKAATVAYLEDYVANLDERARTIAEGIDLVEGLDVAALHRRALAGADLPAFTGSDPAPRWLAQREAKWEGLRDWFRPRSGGMPRADDLRAMAQRAIVSLLRVLERLRDQRRRPASAAADFRTLARWFAGCSTDEDAHRLYNAAFGLWPARHAHLVADDPEATPASTPWADAPPVLVSPLLRSRGRVEHTARTAAVRDTAALRRRRQAEAARERTEVEAAWRRLSTDGPVHLATIGELDHPSLQRLLELVGRALAVPPDRDGRRRAATSDGQLEVVLAPPASQRRAVIRSEFGRLEAPDYVVEVGPATPARGRREATG